MSGRKSTATVLDVNAALACKFWLARCFRDGSPEEDLFRAVCVNSMSLELPQPAPYSERPSLKEAALRTKPVR